MCEAEDWLTSLRERAADLSVCDGWNGDPMLCRHSIKYVLALQLEPRGRKQPGHFWDHPLSLNQCIEFYEFFSWRKRWLVSKLYRMTAIQPAAEDKTLVNPRVVADDPSPISLRFLVMMSIWPNLRTLCLDQSADSDDLEWYHYSSPNAALTPWKCLKVFQKQDLSEFEIIEIFQNQPILTIFVRGYPLDSWFWGPVLEPLWPTSSSRKSILATQNMPILGGPSYLEFP